MSSRRVSIARVVLRAIGLPRVDAPTLDPAAECQFRTAADRSFETGDIPTGVPVLPFLQWLAEDRGVLFHGSIRDDLEILEPIRKSRDETAWGDQQAVYASSDPIWAMYFASLRRDNGFVGTRNASVGIVGGPVYPRWYFFSINRSAPRERRFGPGTIYVLPREPFEAEAPEHDVFDFAHWVAPKPVRPLFRMGVEAADFPFVNSVVGHRFREPTLATMLRAGTRARLRARTHR
jgi:hypothetical protein